MNSRSRSILIAVMTGVLVGVAWAYAAAYSLVDRSLWRKELKNSQEQQAAWSKASSLNTLVSYRAFMARFPDKASKIPAENAIRSLVKDRSPQFQWVNRIRLVVRQTFGEAKTTLPIREMVKEWFSFVGISLLEESDPRYDAVVTVLLNGRALSADYSIRYTGFNNFFPLGQSSRNLERRYSGAVVQGKVSFVGASEVVSEKNFSYRIDPPQSITESEDQGPCRKPEDAPYLEAAKSSLSPAMARLMSDHFGRGVLDRGMTSGNPLIQAGAVAVKKGREKYDR